MVKKGRSYIVQVTIERKETSSGLIGPDLYFIVIAARDKQRLRFMKVNCSHGSIMLFKFLQKR